MRSAMAVPPLCSSMRSVMIFPHRTLVYPRLGSSRIRTHLGRLLRVPPSCKPGARGCLSCGIVWAAVLALSFLVVFRVVCSLMLHRLKHRVPTLRQSTSGYMYYPVPRLTMCSTGYGRCSSSGVGWDPTTATIATDPYIPSIVPFVSSTDPVSQEHPCHPILLHPVRTSLPSFLLRIYI